MSTSSKKILRMLHFHYSHIFQENLSSIKQFITTTRRQLYDMSIRIMALSDMTLMPVIFFNYLYTGYEPAGVFLIFNTGLFVLKNK